MVTPSAKRLGPNQQRVYELLVLYHHRMGEWPSDKVIMERLSLNSGQLRDSMQGLRRRGLVRSDGRRMWLTGTRQPEGV